MSEVSIIGFVLASLFLIYPLYRTVFAWAVDKTMRWPVALGTALAHIFIIIILFHSPVVPLVIPYLIVINLIWFLTPCRQSLREIYLNKRMRKADIVKYQRIIALHPEHAAAHAALADVYADSGRLDEAIAEYETAIRLDPDNSRLDSVKLAQVMAMCEQLEMSRRKKSNHPELTSED